MPLPKIIKDENGNFLAVSILCNFNGVDYNNGVGEVGGEVGFTLYTGATMYAPGNQVGAPSQPINTGPVSLADVNGFDGSCDIDLLLLDANEAPLHVTCLVASANKDSFIASISEVATVVLEIPSLFKAENNEYGEININALQALGVTLISSVVA